MSVSEVVSNSLNVVQCFLVISVSVTRNKMNSFTIARSDLNGNHP